MGLSTLLCPILKSGQKKGQGILLAGIHIGITELEFELDLKD